MIVTCDEHSIDSDFETDVAAKADRVEEICSLRNKNSAAADFCAVVDCRLQCRGAVGHTIADCTEFANVKETPS